MDLFRQAKPAWEPLASRMRPRHLDEYFGQQHILGPGRLLRRAIAADQLSSLLLYGPPGTGKTTLARVIAATTRCRFLSLNAVLAGVKEIRELIDQARETRDVQGQKTLLFVDEVHRWNKAQQDALLPWVENGTFILIGATTENPYFEVNQALVSRSRVFQLLPLDEPTLTEVARAACRDTERGYGRYHVKFEPGALEHLVKTAAGDARSLLNALELAVETSVTPFPPPDGTVITIDQTAAEESIQKRVVLYDKDGDYHFDTISAFIKSIRGSDPDAALYWLAKMVRAGEDPMFIFRRLLISASEDIGLADPQALVIVQAAAEAYHRIGLPEGQFHLAHATLYLANAPKSNSTLGYFEALKAVSEEPDSGVPNHLKDGNRDAKAFGHGQGYLYPHAFKDHWVSQQYLPSSLRDRLFYKPGFLGWEGQVRDQVLRRREAVLALQEFETGAEVLTYSPENHRWKARLDQAGSWLDQLRARLFALLRPARHHVFGVAKDWGGVLLFEGLRQCPEGRTLSWLPEPRQRQKISDYLAFLPDLEQPLLLDREWTALPPPHPLDRLAGIWPRLAPAELPQVLVRTGEVLAPGGLAVLAFRLTTEGQTLSQAAAGVLSAEETALLAQAEQNFRQTRQSLELDRRAFAAWPQTRFELFHETLQMTEVQLAKWFAPDQADTPGPALKNLLGPQFSEFLNRIAQKLLNQDLPWFWTFAMLEIPGKEPA